MYGDNEPDRLPSSFKMVINYLDLPVRTFLNLLTFTILIYVNADNIEEIIININGLSQPTPTTKDKSLINVVLIVGTINVWLGIRLSN